MFADKIDDNSQNLMFERNNRRKKRQAPEPPLTLEEFNITDQQREFCNNDRSCLFDLAASGSEELAAITREASESIAALQMLLSKNN